MGEYLLLDCLKNKFESGESFASVTTDLEKISYIMWFK